MIMGCLEKDHFPDGSNDLSENIFPFPGGRLPINMKRSSALDDTF